MTLPDFFAIMTGFAGIVAIFYRASAAQSKSDLLIDKVEDLRRSLERQETRHAKELKEAEERSKQDIERQNKKIEVLEEHRKYDKRFIDMLMKSYVEPDIKK